MRSTLLPLLAGVMCLAGPVRIAAQMPDESAAPKVLMVIREQIKEGREAAHARAEQAWPRIFGKANLTSNYYIGMNSYSGPSESWFLEPYDSFAAMEKDRAAVQNSALAADLETANVQDGDLRTGSRTWLSVFRPDLSYHAAEAMSSMPKCRHMGVTVLRIKYGHDADLAQAAKLLIDGDEKTNADQPVLTYQITSGGPSGLYLLFSPMDSLARLDGAPARTAAARQAMGERNRQRFDALAGDVVQSSESFVFSVDPHMSYVSKEFAAGDPGFWNPAPKEPAKPVVKARKPVSAKP